MNGYLYASDNSFLTYDCLLLNDVPGLVLSVVRGRPGYRHDGRIHRRPRGVRPARGVRMRMVGSVRLRRGVGRLGLGRVAGLGLVRVRVRLVHGVGILKAKHMGGIRQSESVKVIPL